MASADALTTEPEETRAAGGWARRWRWPLMIGGPVVILAVVLWFALTSGRSQSTDDAYVEAARVPVSASIGGRVIELDVKENQPVKAGQVLFRLDVDTLSTNLAQAEAQLSSARLQVELLRAAVSLQQTSLATATATAAYADREAARQKALLDAGVASRDQYEAAVHAAENAHHDIATAQQQVAQAIANLGGANVTSANHPMVMQAKAAVDRARINVLDGTVTAPQDGIVTRVEQLQVGTYINPAQTLFWLVSGTPWVEANFKEDQLGKMKVGQPATIRVDAFGSHTFRGHVESFSPGSGQAFSPLPAQNATGNWVKVVQRLPVRIAFDETPPDMAGRAGLSAVVTVDVRPDSERRASGHP